MKKVKDFTRILFLSLIICLTLPSVVWASEAGTTTEAVEISLTVTYGQTEAREMLQLINEFRTGSDAWYWNDDNTTKTTCTDLFELTYDYELEAAAMLRAAELAISFSHTRPNGELCKTALGTYSCSAYGENIAYGYTSAEEVFEAWQETEEDYDGQGHRRNMLSSEFTAVGIGHVYYNGVHYWVQEFAKPSSTGSGTATEANDGDTTVSVEVLLDSDTGITISSSLESYSMSVGDSEALPILTVTVKIGKIDYPVTAEYTWVIEDSGSDYVSVTDNKLTAAASGDTNLTTTVLGETVDIPVHVHTYGVPDFSWADDYSTCTAAFTCTNCTSDSNSKTVECTVTSETTDATCTDDGETVYTATCEFEGSNYSDTQSVEIAALGHTTELQNAVAATCTEEGYSGDTVCTVCGDTLETGEVIPATGHTAETQDAKEATCTEEGYTGDEVCTVCGETIETGETIPATGHTTEIQNTKAATCTEDGYTGDEVCTVCDETITKGETIEATGHTTELQGAKAATCTEDGYTGDYVCTVCSDTVTAGETIAATGHTTEVQNAKAATCTESGYTGDEICTVCGVTVTAGETTAATESTNGVRTYTCTVCGATKTETIAATGSSDTSAGETDSTTGETDASTDETDSTTGETDATTGETDPSAKEGLTLDGDGVFRYYQDNQFAEDYAGVVPYDGGLFFIKNGLIDFGANELCLYGNVWYYVSLGQVQLQYTGLAIHDGAWFYITNGLLDTTVNGLVSYNGETFVVAVGRICVEYSGLWLNAVSIGGNNQWYYIGAGMVQKVSQIVMYDGAFFIVKDGILDTGSNGTITYGGAAYIVVNGQLYAA